MSNLSKPDGPQTPEDNEKMLKYLYRETDGGAHVNGKVDTTGLACAIRAVARLCKNSGLAHKKEMLKVTQYLLHTKEWEITYDGEVCGGVLGLVVWNLTGY